MTSPPSCSESPKAKYVTEAPAFDFHFNPTTEVFHPQNAAKDTFCPNSAQDTVYFPPNHNIFLDQRFNMHDTFLPPVDYTATSEQVKVTSDASSETSLETLKIALSMVLDSIWQLKSEYQARIEVVER
jgi:hypothetical protein